MLYLDLWYNSHMIGADSGSNLRSKCEFGSPCMILHTELHPTQNCMHTPTLFSTGSDHWQYVAEGGATAVFAYVGPPDSDLDGMVLRLQKCLPEGGHGKAALAKPNEKAASRTQDLRFDFQEQVVARLIPVKYLPVLRRVYVHRSLLATLVQQAHNMRPAGRLLDNIDMQQTSGLLATNLVGRHGVVLEIKVSPQLLPSALALSTLRSLSGDFFPRPSISHHKQRL